AGRPGVRSGGRSGAAGRGRAGRRPCPQAARRRPDRPPRFRGLWTATLWTATLWTTGLSANAAETCVRPGAAGPRSRRNPASGTRAPPGGAGAGPPGTALPSTARKNALPGPRGAGQPWGMAPFTPFPPRPPRPTQAPSFTAALTALLLGEGCAGCGAPGGRVCAECADALAPRPHRCAAREGCPPARAARRYTGPARALLLAYKHRRIRSLSGPLAARLAGAARVAAPRA